MKVAIVGAGVAGAYLSGLLAEKGCSNLLFDHLAPYEKPCGGGVTSKAIREFPFLESQKIAKREIHFIKFVTPGGSSYDFPLSSPFYVCSRKELSRFLIDRALQSGARFIPEKVLRVEKRKGRWKVISDKGSHSADLVVGADGVKSIVRRQLWRNFDPRDLSLAVVGYIKGGFEEKAKVCFLSGVEGYIWWFPRQGYASVGIGSPLGQMESHQLEILLRRFILECLPSKETIEASFKWALVPSLRAEEFLCQRYSGERWALVGDAAGLVDPLTREGIYYALKSAQLLAEAILKGELGEYDRMLQREFLGELHKAAQLRKRFYSPWFLEIGLRLAAASRDFREIALQLLLEKPAYTRLKKRLLRKGAPGAAQSIWYYLTKPLRHKSSPQ